MHMCVCMCACMCVCAYICVRACVCAHVHVCSVHMCIRVYAYIHVCECEYEKENGNSRSNPLFLLDACIVLQCTSTPWLLYGLSSRHHVTWSRGHSLQALVPLHIGWILSSTYTVYKPSISLRFDTYFDIQKLW